MKIPTISCNTVSNCFFSLLEFIKAVNYSQTLIKIFEHIFDRIFQYCLRISSAFNVSMVLFSQGTFKEVPRSLFVLLFF